MGERTLGQSQPPVHLLGWLAAANATHATSKKLGIGSNRLTASHGPAMVKAVAFKFTKWPSERKISRLLIL